MHTATVTPELWQPGKQKHDCILFSEGENFSLGITGTDASSLSQAAIRQEVALLSQACSHCPLLVTLVQVKKVVSAVLRAAHLGSELYWRWACWKLSRSSCRCRCTCTSTDTECRPLCDAGRELGCGRDAQLVSEGMTPALSGLK